MVNKYTIQFVCVVNDSGAKKLSVNIRELGKFKVSGQLLGSWRFVEREGWIR